MTRAEFAELVRTYCKTFGRQYAEAPAALNAVVNERLLKFTELTKCLYDDAVALTLTAHTGTYALDGAGLSKVVIEPDIVVVDGTTLIGPITAQAGYAGLGYYPDDDEDKPNYWALNGNYLRLIPTPDQVYTGCKVGGVVGHTQFDLDSTDDDEAIEIPATSIRAAAVYTAVALAFPGSTGSEDLQLVQAWDASAAAEIDRLVNKYQQVRFQASVRGYGSEGGTYILG